MTISILTYPRKRGSIMGTMGRRKDVQDLGKQLREAILASQLSRFAIAKRTGVSYSILHRFTSNDRDITLRTASKFAEVLGLELRPVDHRRKEE